MSAIKFGTDGWRAVVADQFTVANVRLVAQAMADVLRSETPQKPLSLVVGYDTRFMSEHFAKTIAEVLAANDIHVYLSDGVAPTPVVSFMVRHLKARGGVVVTASHNPPHFNGIKFKDSYGGPAHPQLTQKFEQAIGRSAIKIIPFAQALSEKKVIRSSFQAPYEMALKSYLHMDILQKATWSVAVDSMHGAGEAFIQKFLQTSFAGKVHTINHDINPSFGGTNPEPIAKNLIELLQLCAGSYDVGLATDGDGDRLGVVDDRGEFVFSHQLIALLVLYLQESRGWKGSVVKSISTTALIDAIAKDKGLEVIETPIGFKYICALMNEKDVLVGGEESGGIGFKNHMPERDGFLAGLLVLEMMSFYQKPLSVLLKNMGERYGFFYYDRNDVHYDALQMQPLLARIPTLRPKEILGVPVSHINDRDGMKYIFSDGSWLLIRASGTEPVLRIYAESRSRDKVRELLVYGERMAFGVEPSLSRSGER